MRSPSVINILFIVTSICAINLVSCQRNEISNQLIESNDISFETKKFDIADNRYQSDPALQSHFTLEYPLINEDIPELALQNINAYIAGFILDSETPVKEFPNIKKQADKLFHEYDDAYAEFPRTSTWIVDKQIKIASKLGPLICLSFSESSYKGGAHPNSNTFYKIFDLTDGHLVDIYEILDSTQLTALNDIRLKVLKEQKNEVMKEEDWLFYMFEEAFEPNGSFYINKNMKVAKDTIEFYYNSYEIAAYAFGPTELKISVDEIKPLLLKSSPYYQYF
ncbi:MAG TPA: RsiV family protein [Chitinophagales bacterium]|nr:RsiV family protein [Chitinophagales bacterium]